MQRVVSVLLAAVYWLWLDDRRSLERTWLRRHWWVVLWWVACIIFGMVIGVPLGDWWGAKLFP